jgi:hypothetical protein
MTTIFILLGTGAFAALGVFLFIKAPKIAEATFLGDNPLDILRLIEWVLRKEKGSLSMPVLIWMLRIIGLGFIFIFFFIIYKVITSN